jgi:arylsulfatase A-like enzyme
MHEDGAARMVEMKKQIDGPIAQLLRDLKQRGLLDRTLVVIESEFGRTIASDPAQQIDGKAGTEAIGATEEHDGTKLVIDSEKMYGFHGHFSTNHTVVLLGGGIRGGTVHGKTADRHPMLPVENPVELPDVHATIYKALGIPADHSYLTEGRPFYVTKDGKGKAINAVLA